MNRWDVPESLFEPVIAAVPAGTEWSGFVDPFFVAADGTPVTAAKVGESVVERIAYAYSSDGAKPYHARARLLERVRGGTPAGQAGVLWEVGVTVLKRGTLKPVVPEDFECAILTSVSVQMTEAGMSGGPQLALLRHKWAEAVKAASPDAIVFGGQHHWRDEWWVEAEGWEARS
jgi:hypothetical protein